MSKIYSYFWPLALILAIILFVFSPTLSHGFVSWDDEGHLLENLHVRSLDLDNINKIFHTTVNKTYIPLTIFSFAVEYHWFGYNPFIYHLDNLLLHLGVVALVYVLALRLGLSLVAAALAALLFGIHPMHVESVAWVTQRKDVLYSLFYVLALVHYVGYIKDGRASSYVWALLCAVLSILAKPMALSLPLVLCLLDWFLKRRWSFGLLWEKLPFALTIFPVAWWTYALNMRAVELSFPQASLTWLWSMAFYISKFFFPKDLLVLYQLPQPVSFSNPEFILAVGLVLIILFVLYRLKKYRLLLFAAAYFFLSVFFLLRFDSKQDLTFVADRFMYLPSLGICIGLGFAMDWALGHWGKKGREVRLLILGSLVAVLCMLGALAHMQAKRWGDEYLLWSSVNKIQPSSVAYNQLGNYFLNRKDYARALENYQRAAELNPRYNKPYSNRGLVFFYLGRYAEAIVDFTKAIEVMPNEAVIAYNNRGYAYWLLGKPKDALNDYDKAIALDPEYSPAYLNRATVYKSLGNLVKAMADLKSVLHMDPQNGAAKNNIRILEGMMKNVSH